MNSSKQKELQRKLEEELKKELQLLRFDAGLPFPDEWKEYIEWLNLHQHDIKKKKFE